MAIEKVVADANADGAAAKKISDGDGQPLLKFPLALWPLLLAVCSWLLLCATVGSRAEPVTKRDFELVFENFTCAPLAASSRPFVRRLSCGLGKNSKRPTLKMDMTFARDIASYQMDMLIVLPRKQQSPFVLLNFTRLDGCELLANKKQVTLLHLSRTNLERYSNYPKACPFRQDVQYYVRGYRWDMDMMPALTIETPVHIQFAYWLAEQRIIDGYITCRLELKEGKKNYAHLLGE